jgi:hypothetical protein
MGLLSPLYLVGLAALALPILFHLVRRTPRGRQEFSSLMFLEPSPPILTRRSRLDQILLLLLRLAALALLACAFARPFLRESATLPFDALPGRRLALLVDTSASMRRGDLFQQAKAVVTQVLDDLGPEDEVSLYVFGDRCRRIMGPDEIEASAATNRAAVLKDRVKDLSPDWTAGDLGSALVMVAGELDSSTDVNKSAADPEIIVVTDGQQGTRVEALQAFEWPPRVRVSVTPVTLKSTTNAQVALLSSPDDAPSTEPRVRIASASDSKSEEFRVRWGSETGPVGDNVASAYVPPGQSRVIKLPRPEGSSADRLLLDGDEQSFDNTWYVAPERREALTVLYIGDDDPADANGQRYYLNLALAGDPLREVTIARVEDATAFSNRDARLLVVNGRAPEGTAPALKGYVESGGTVLFSPATREDAAWAAGQLGVTVLEEAGEGRREGQFWLLGQIDFSNPVFSAFANPRYGDFTKIHFWNRWALEVPIEDGLHVLARFDDGKPAVVERRMGAGRLILLASSWRPDDSQLALSSKFVPFIGGLMQMAYGRSGSLSAVVVNEPISLPEWRGQRPTAVIRPDGKRETLAADAKEFGGATEPGIYRVVYGVEELPCAVNLAASESQTAPMEMAQLAQLGVRMGVEPPRISRAEAIRQQRDVELEARQKLWRWGVIALLVVLIVETWWGGVRSRASLVPLEAAS